MIRHPARLPLLLLSPTIVIRRLRRAQAGGRAEAAAHLPHHVVDGELLAPSRNGSRVILTSRSAGSAADRVPSSATKISDRASTDAEESGGIDLPGVERSH